VKDYTYLGTIITNKNELRQEIEKRITHAKRAYYTLLPLLKEPISTQRKKNKIKICKTLIRPVAIYGAESWILNKDFISFHLLKFIDPYWYTTRISNMSIIIHNLLLKILLNGRLLLKEKF